MRVERSTLTSSHSLADSILGKNADLVFYFGNRQRLESENVYASLQKIYPNSIIAGCSTGGEIFGESVQDESIITLAVDFEKTEVDYASTPVTNPKDSLNAGIFLGTSLNKKNNLKGIIVFSDGLNVNGSALTRGIVQCIDKNVPLMGGLAGDGGLFEKTLVGVNTEPLPNQVIAIGFYGDSIHFNYGSAGGWDMVGSERVITRSEGNILFEFDGKPALELYKNYIGKMAEQLPSSGLLFPIIVWPKGHKESSLVRTILAVDEENQSLIFAGDVTQGHSTQMMRGFLPRLVKAASFAAEQSKKKKGHPKNDTNSIVSLLISCIGRKLLFGQRISEEVESVAQSYAGLPYNQIGFYSYGEIAPHPYTDVPELHNQTMTITTFYED